MKSVEISWNTVNNAVETKAQTFQFSVQPDKWFCGAGEVWILIHVHTMHFSCFTIPNELLDGWRFWSCLCPEEIEIAKMQARGTYLI